jgi:5'(3')-deoxyribonucleotidase
MKIAFDLDDTLVNHDRNRLRLSRQLGYTIPIRDFYTKKAKNIIPKSEYTQFKSTLYKKISLSAPPIKNAVEIFNQLNQDHVLFIISRRQPHDGGVDFAQQWITEHLPSLSPNRIHFVARDEDKNVLCQKLGIDVIVDNKASVLRHINPPTQIVLLDRYNSEPKLDRAIVITELSELHNTLQNILTSL